MYKYKYIIFLFIGLCFIHCSCYVKWLNRIQNSDLSKVELSIALEDSTGLIRTYLKNKNIKDMTILKTYQFLFDNNNCFYLWGLNIIYEDTIELSLPFYFIDCLLPRKSDCQKIKPNDSLGFFFSIPFMKLHPTEEYVKIKDTIFCRIPFTAKLVPLYTVNKVNDTLFISSIKANDFNYFNYLSSLSSPYYGKYIISLKYQTSPIIKDSLKDFVVSNTLSLIYKDRKTCFPITENANKMDSIKKSICLKREKSNNVIREVHLLSGDAVFKNTDGRIRKEGYFEKGCLKEGKEYCYSPEGELIKTYIYKKDYPLPIEIIDHRKNKKYIPNTKDYYENLY